MLAAALKAEHVIIDAGIERIMSELTLDVLWSGTVHAATASLRRHIYLEEEILFPPFREAEMAGPIVAMLRDHGRMWEILGELDRIRDFRLQGERTRQLVGDLVLRLSSHNSVEEEIIYPQADSILGDSSMSVLHGFLRSGTVPDGWVCDFVRRGEFSPSQW
jgi:hemerythrin superfamily protein